MKQQNLKPDFIKGSILKRKYGGIPDDSSTDLKPDRYNLIAAAGGFCSDHLNKRLVCLLLPQIQK